MAIILKANKLNLFVSSVLFVFWYHSPNVLDTLRTLVYFAKSETGHYGALKDSSLVRYYDVMAGK
jgi:hypothetical protein